MTDDQKINQVERDRKRREAELLALLLWITDDARKHARSALKLGVAPVAAADQVILGNPSTDQPGGANAVSMAMKDAYEAGYKRVYRWASKKSSPDFSLLANQYYDSRASRVILSLSNKLGSVIAEGLSDIRGINDSIRALNKALVDGGLSEKNDNYLALAAEQAIVSTYNEGMYAAYLTPEIKNDLRGFTHVSIVDPGTTNICRERDGFVRGIDDPYWLTNWPMLHFGCRSVVLPVYLDEWDGDHGDYPTTEPMDGFGQAPGFLMYQAA